MEEIFYRIGCLGNNQGLWYSKTGEFTGLIHNEYNFCTNSSLEMPFDEEVKGFISVATSLEELYKWFPLNDIALLCQQGFAIEYYKSSEKKFYDKFQHYLIPQTSELIGFEVVKINVEYPRNFKFAKEYQDKMFDNFLKLNS